MDHRLQSEESRRPHRTRRTTAPRVRGRLLIVIAVAAAIGLWQLVRPPAPRAAGITSPARRARSTQPRPFGASPAAARRTAALPARDPEARTLTAVHLTLHRWLETQTGDTQTQDQLMRALLAVLTDENAAGIARSLSADELGTPFGMAVLERWLGVDAVRAALWIGGQPEATDAQAWLVARKLLSDPASLQACCDRLPDTGWKQNFLAAAGLQGAAQAPVQAINLAQQMKPGPDQTNILQTIAYDWVGADPTAAMNWIASVTDPALRESLAAAGAKALAATDPDLAASWLAAAVQSTGTLNDTALSVAEIWVTQDPAKAAAWVTHFPAGHTRENAVGTILYHWLRTDPDAATAWFLSLPDRDAILARLTSDQAGFERAADVQ